MENNHLDVRGDLEHKVWKRHAEPGDIVLKRKRGSVLVLNYSIGVWQITRETLRSAPSLYIGQEGLFAVAGATASTEGPRS